MPSPRVASCSAAKSSLHADVSNGPVSTRCDAGLRDAGHGRVVVPPQVVAEARVEGLLPTTTGQGVDPHLRDPGLAHRAPRMPVDDHRLVPGGDGVSGRGEVALGSWAPGPRRRSHS